MLEHLAKLAKSKGLILGSGSPRRVALLNEAGINFRQSISDIEEERHNGEGAMDFAQRMAELKAITVASKTSGSDIVLGCDTVVVLDDELLGKPFDEEMAFEILSKLSGKTHTVSTALALATGSTILAASHDITQVHFNEVSSDQIREYIATGEPMDKAGAYGIQGMGAFLVDEIDGELDNVVGLPRKLLDQLAKEVLSRL